MTRAINWAILGLCAFAATASAAPTTTPAQAEPQKILIDTDFNTIGDDGQVLAMAAQLHKSKTLQILGLTTVTGNQWLAQGVSDGLKAVERLGIEEDVGIYVGANEPLLHTYAAHQQETKRFGNGTLYVGAYSSPPDAELVAPPDGFATHTTPRARGAVQFILDTVHKYPHEVTILAIGPLTNLALALRTDPSIAPLIKGIAHMGGQLYAAGNSYNGAGEINWWMDPEAARVVLRAPIPKTLYPLDLTNTVPISNATYDAIGSHEPATAVTELVRGMRRWPYAYDAIALASLVDPRLNRNVRELYVDIDCDSDGESYGKGLVWTEDPYAGTGLTTAASVVFSIDNDRFFETYVDLLTRPIAPLSN
ncbi:inosine-uridine preferring nucleoside hydrolase [Apiospora marii]|uniref:inosine-uridine preferring nucleoside hydrolase n=1 Tax=Apiospora marii TaxID=335849 RepID=UPI00312F02D1